MLAVLLAAQSLSLLALFGGQPPRWLDPTLLGLGLVKFTILYYILRNTLQANREDWNVRAVDYRYLAERLRTLHYLPRLGSFQPPEAARPYHARRAQHQTAVDWLFEAMLRAVSPAELAEPTEVPGHDGTGTLRLPLLTLVPGPTLDRVRSPWISEQIVYHRRNADAYAAMDRRAERSVNWLSRIVLGVVFLDLLIVGAVLAVHWVGEPQQLPGWAAEVLGTLGASAHALHHYTPCLLLLAAVLPATVAALDGLRFQSEAGRLAERSRTLTQTLDGRRAEAEALAQRIAEAQTDPDRDPGAWSLDGVRLGERVAEDCVREVAEWRVLYAKELPEV